jgi:hypothetical protein
LHWLSPAAIVKYRPELLSERVPHNKPATVKRQFKGEEKKIGNLVSEGGLTPGQTLTLKAREISRPANSCLVSLRISF